MNDQNFQKLWTEIKKNLETGREKLETKMPEIESKIYTYAQKIGINPQDIDKAKDKVRQKIKEFQDKK
ncbi:hypothetical protein [Desulfonatronovibrio magnus]|uniref:hypothetical protein n=1 Tax=Desulfonatronovibrio magnus TaxID=698827 RepID=UPI0005EBDDD1|nr:hypothetical protein [Desulfonatronovibrio magnus]